jgi:aminopeptidase-like protein
MSTMMEMLRAIYPLALAPVSSGADRSVEILRQELPFSVLEFPSGAEVNGWVVPRKWEVDRALIRREGEVVYDGTRHPLGVIGYSTSFSGTLPLEELKEHLHYHHLLDDALVYHYIQFYRNWERQWGFSMPRRLYDSLPPGEYEVELATRHEPGTMKVLHDRIPGRSEQTISFVAHNCHAGQANDDIAGVVVGVELMRRLRERDNRYSYELVVGPEQFSSLFFLDSLGAEGRALRRWGVYLEMLGSDSRLALQRSFHGDSELDYAAEHALRRHEPALHVGDFRQVVGNDETVWEAPGYEIPMISISRSAPVSEGHPYPQYHSDLDNEELIEPRRLEEAVEALLDVVEVLERNDRYERLFEGHVALSNPRYDLYLQPAGDPARRDEDPETMRRWFQMLVRLPRSFDGRTSTLDIARAHGLDFFELRSYLRGFEEKGLVRALPPPREPSGG